jgi:hypothetical protein
MSTWTEADSRALDAEVRALRQADRRERSGMPAPVTQAESRGYGTKRLTDEDVRRRKKVEWAMRKRERREVEKAVQATAREAKKDERSETYKANRAKRRPRVRMPKPKQKPNGRWLAETTIGGRKRGKTFDTEQDAQAWLDQLIDANTTEED